MALVWEVLREITAGAVYGGLLVLWLGALLILGACMVGLLYSTYQVILLLAELF